MVLDDRVASDSRRHLHVLPVAWPNPVGACPLGDSLGADLWCSATNKFVGEYSRSASDLSRVASCTLPLLEPEPSPKALEPIEVRAQRSEQARRTRCPYEE